LTLVVHATEAARMTRAPLRFTSFALLSFMSTLGCKSGTTDDEVGDAATDDSPTTTAGDTVDTTAEGGTADTTTTTTTDTADTEDTADTVDTADTSTGDGDGDTSCAGYFPPDAIWCVDVTDAPTTADSATVIDWLDDAGWGNNGNFQIDFSIEVLEADAATPRREFEATDEFYSPDCDWIEIPVPDGGALEGENGYECTTDGDCHLIVVERDEGRLYEMWRANIVGDQFYGGCMAVWDMNMTYDNDGRGQGCTSADAAGFPIAPLLFDADEVAAGSIDHAIRFILPNDNIRHFIYVAPATHSTFPTSGPAEAPPYGVHLRLRADYPVDSLPSAGAQVVARAMQQYGMFLADGGQIALTARSDRFTTAKWDGLLAPQDLVDLTPGDFEVIDHGPGTDWETVECSRTPLGTPP
jgi:hypothetical protein